MKKGRFRDKGREKQGHTKKRQLQEQLHAAASAVRARARGEREREREEGESGGRVWGEGLETRGGRGEMGKCRALSHLLGCRRWGDENMDTLGIEPRASRMLSGCDTITPCAHLAKV